MVPLRGRDVVLPWGRLRVWEGGHGPLVVALHGLGGSGRYWQGLADVVGSSFKVIAPDHAGFGHSDKPPLTYDRALHLASIDAVVRDMAGGGQVILVGHSLGGIMAALWTAQNPTKVAALALVATPFPIVAMPSDDVRKEAWDQRPLMRRAYHGFQVLWPLVSRPIVSQTFPRAVIDDYMRHSLLAYWGTAKSFLWSADAGDELAALSSVDLRIALILSASDDKRVPAEETRQWARLLPGASTRTTSGGHQLLLRTHFAPLAAWIDESVRPLFDEKIN